MLKKDLKEFFKDIKEVLKNVILDIVLDSISIFILLFLDELIEGFDSWSELLEEAMMLIFTINVKCIIVSAKNKIIDKVFWFSHLFSYFSLGVYIALKINVDVNELWFNRFVVVSFITTVILSIILEYKVLYSNRKKEEDKAKEKEIKEKELKEKIKEIKNLNERILKLNKENKEIEVQKSIDK